MNFISYEDFSKIEICVGTIISAIEGNKLRKPSIILEIDFGQKIGIKKSSAQLRVNYNCEYLIDRQIIAVINFQPKQVGNIMSEVLVLGLPDNNNEPILVSPLTKVLDGNKIF